ncbi:MAG: hypothetical protein AAF570_13435, partial [Bacteroidota bacterium]
MCFKNEGEDPEKDSHPKSATPEAGNETTTATPEPAKTKPEKTKLIGKGTFSVTDQNDTEHKLTLKNQRIFKGKKQVGTLDDYYNYNIE